MAESNRYRVLFLAILLIVGICTGEYFGRNKVQYENFRFKVLNTEHYKIFYYPSEFKMVKDAGRMLERWNTRYTKIFGKPLASSQPVILYANTPDFQQTNAISGIIEQGVGGVTEGYLNRMILPLTGIYEENDHVLGHELVHAFQYEIMKSNELGLSGGSNIPLWFIEGMAEYLSVGSLSPLTSMWLRDAVMFNDVPGITQIEHNMKYFPYRYGQALWAYIGGKYGDQVIGQLYMSIVQGNWQNAFSDVLGVSVDSLSHDWVQEIKTVYGNQINGRQVPSAVGRRILDREELSLSPNISPDGKLLAVFSSKDLFAIDLFIVDVSNGKIIRRLGSAESDQYYDGVRYVNSTGSWSPDSKKFAFITYRKGNNAIGIYNVISGKYRQTITLKNIDEILDISWSPDGNTLAIAGTAGGESNLYLYSMKEKKIKQITKGKYAELMPSWSPDGKTLLFVTDRGEGTDVDSLIYGPMKIGRMSLETGEISLLSMAPWVKHIDPLFSKDGRDIFFIADPDGISNIYRYSLVTQKFYRVTNIATGVSGLTELSSAMSIARDNQEIVFNVFEKDGYKVQRIDSTQTIGSLFVPFQIDYFQNAVLPPGGSRGGGIVNEYLCNASEGLVTGQSFLVKNYRPRLKLLYIGQLYAGISADPLGVGVAGGISFLFSDLLGDHMLGIGAQVSGRIQDFGGEITYLNMGSRIHWGLSLNRVPYYSTTTTVSDTVTEDGGSAQKIAFLDQYIYDNNITALFTLPLTVNRRLEFNAGYTYEGYDYRVEEVTVQGNTVLEDKTRNIDAPSGLNLFQTSLGYVGDYSFFGLTGPVSGRRFRLEVGPSFGSLQFLTLLADYRQYIFLDPFTLAFRFFHYGRYLRDSKNERLSTFYLGTETWIRGYEYYTFDLTECSDKNGNCPEYDRLQGSRIGVVNFELRYPLIGVERYGLINFRYLPVDLVTFLDGGVAWDGNDKPVPKIVRHTDDRIPVFSVGAATRINILGLLILQIYYVYPFQRTDEGAHWGFIFAPGW